MTTLCEVPGAAASPPHLPLHLYSLCSKGLSGLCSETLASGATTPGSRGAASLLGDSSHLRPCDKWLIGQEGP